MRAFENCLVCGASTENTHSARRGSDALVCGGDCYKQASRNFKRGMSGYKVARLVDLLAQMGGPVTAAQLLARYRDTYGKSAMMGFNNTNAVTQQLMPIVNPETIRVDKTKNPFTFEYLGGTTIGEWLKPSMRAKYESVSFKAEADKDYEWEWDSIDNAPTELIKKRLKEAGFKLDSSGKGYGNVIVEFYEPKLVAKNGNLLDVTLSQNEEFDGFSRLTFYDDNDENTTGKAPPMDWDILYEKGLLKGEDSVENPQSDYYQVYWDGLYDEWKNGHNCADNAKFDIYGDNFIVMECEVCGKTATFEQKTPYEGPRKRKDAETFEAEYGPSVEGMIDNPAGYYSYWQSFCEYLGVNDAHTAWRMVEKPWKWRPELEKWVNDSEWFSQEAESFEAEELEISVGDRVRSYDFILPDGTLIRDDCYMEGRVTKIAPVDWCGSECDHYYILVDRVVRNGEEIDSKTFTDGQMVFPPVSESYIEVVTSKTFDVEFNDWANQEMMTHGKDISFNDWAEEEGKKHGGMDLTDWAKEEEESHDERYAAETDEYKGPFEVEIRRPNGAVATWKKYDNYGKLIEALEEIVSKRYTPYAIDVFATNVPYISGFTAMGPVTDYRKFHLATWKYGNWESGPWAKHFPTGLE